MKLVSAFVVASVALVVAWFVFAACSPPPLPPEPPLVMTVSCAARDAGR